VAIVLLVAYLWVVHAVLALPVVAPLVWFTRKRIHWSWTEGLVFAFPFAAWMTLMIGAWIGPTKTLSNLAEAP
jgi:hypothetical protein